MAKMTVHDFLDGDGMFREDVEPPPSLGACVDLYHEARELRLAMEKMVKEGVAKIESAFREHLIANLSSSADTGVAGQKYRAQIVKKMKVNVTDWGTLHSWIAKNDRFDMLQKRISDAAVIDWMDQSKRQLPGTETLNVPEISVTKIPGR